MNLKLKITDLLLLFLLISCSNKDKTHAELLEKDRLELAKSLDSDRVLSYKFGKILIRAAVEKDTISTEFQTFKSDIDRVFNKVVKYDIENADDLSLLDYISIYRDYKKMQGFIIKTDEDIFPSLSDAFNVIYGDSAIKKRAYYTGKEKQKIQNIEHAILSAIVILSNDLGKEVALYECSKTNPESLPDSEIKTLLQFYRGFLFFEKKLYYLSEDEFSRNIDWLNNNKNIDLAYTRAFFKWGNMDNGKTHIGSHALNHLFRGYDRLMMDTENDEKLALEDFEIFLTDADKIGVSNEIVWSVEVYFYLKKEENGKAINALKKLSSSNLLSSDEKESIDESIGYLKNREPGKVLNGFYDKFFLGKIATKYMFSVLSKIDWKKVLKEQNVPHTDEMFETIDHIQELNKNLQKYTSTDNLKERTNDVEKKGKGIWDKAKELVK